MTCGLPMKLRRAMSEFIEHDAELPAHVASGAVASLELYLEIAGIEMVDLLTGMGVDDNWTDPLLDEPEPKDDPKAALEERQPKGSA